MRGYRVPLGLAARVAGSVLSLRPRSFAADSLRAVQALEPPVRYECARHIPARGPCLVVCNHFSAPGYGAWWTTFAISAAVARHRTPGAARELHWVITAAWRGAGDGWRSRALARVTGWAFRRVALVYGFVNMPPMPPRPDEVAARARSVLQTVRLARSAAQAGGLLGLSPEGQDHAGGLGEPPAGAGEFIALLVEAGLPVLPAGVSQADGQLRVRFGPVFIPRIPPKRDNRDGVVARQVMDAIGRCLEG
jgi:1-acyl-sn-glycerol-3-phosphate acyltransferase